MGLGFSLEIKLFFIYFVDFEISEKFLQLVHTLLMKVELSDDLLRVIFRKCLIYHFLGRP